MRRWRMSNQIKRIVIAAVISVSVPYMIYRIQYTIYARETECKEPVYKVDSRVVSWDTLTQEQKRIVNAAKIRCGFIYRNSPCVKEIRFDTETNHTSVICTGDQQNG